MAYTFNNQSLLRFTFNTNLDISAASQVKILYQKPDGTKGEWIGSVSETTKVIYDLAVGDIDQVGTWKMQAYAIISGREGYGDHVYVTVKQNFD